MKKGFTLIEILIVVAIVGLLTLAVIMGMSGQRSKAEDARVKSDLERLKIAFEDYYGDNNCYPPATFFDNSDDCGSNALAPYLNTMPCNPKTGIPYTLEYVPDQCSGFRLYATLQNPDDPGAVSLRSNSGGASTLGNYGVSSSNTNVSIYYDGSGEALPPGHLYYYCSGIGNCTSFNASIETCTPYYTDNANCDGNGSSKCFSVGTCNPL